jgi:signal transduction histidine kinase/CheY-like chemotaxis protein
MQGGAAPGMAARQRIVRIRREYNQWVANQTLEDYALRFTAKAARRWSPWRVANTALGGISFLALEAIGGTVTLGYGFTNAVAAIVFASVLIFAAGVPISYYAARDGVDIDLLTRGAGFGYIGSTITSLIYASFTFIFFAIEAVILASMLETCFGIPPPLGFLLCSLAVVPLVTHGITFISRVQLWSQPVWVAMQILPFIVVAFTVRGAIANWTGYPGAAPGADGSFNLLGFGAAASVVFSLIAQIGEQVDYLRFLPQQRGRPSRAWWAAMLAGGPGWIVIGMLKLLAGSFLACLALAAGLAPQLAMQPNEMYRVAFGAVVSSPTAALALAGCFVVISQVKINITNAYAGSIAWSNFFSRLTHRHPGRVVWLVFNIAIALLLMELGIYQAIEGTLVIYSVVAAAWVGALVADLVVNKPLGLSPSHIEFKRAHLYDINPVGTGAMLLAVAAGLLSYGRAAGLVVEAFAPFVAFAAAFAAAPVIAWATDGRYYLARKPRRHWARLASLQCVICENPFEPEDMAFCPAYSGAICSLCCSLDARCHDACKPQARMGRQAAAMLQRCLPRPLRGELALSIGRYAGMLALLAAGIGLVLAGLHVQLAGTPSLGPALWTAFLVLLPFVGVLAWLLVLNGDSRRAAQEETRRQTALLLAEISAHRRTDAKLQRAKEAAEAANLAKSRYVVGISHELRSPLNAILGYAQLLERDTAISTARRHHIGIMRRSGEHMAGLIEGLLDISKIEAGRIEIYRDEVRLGEFVQQLVSMFRLQAEERGIGFVFRGPPRMPDVVYTDERRLRQILINLLSNAVKFTHAGEVRFSLHWRSEIAEFEVEDTGIGIAEADLQRIFEPFERVEPARAAVIPGIGLGLTITRLLTAIMGGDLTVTSVPGAGSRFCVRLRLSEALHPRKPAPIESRMLGYEGRRITVLVSDDDPVHRGLLQDLLTPLGFVVHTATNGDDCVRAAAECQPDLLLVDISMPGLNGWQVAERLRADGMERLVIIVISANAGELERLPGEARFHDDVLAKPIGVADLLRRVGHLLQIEWMDDGAAPEGGAAPGVMLGPMHTQALRELGAIGYVRGIHARLDAIEGEQAESRPMVAHLRQLVSQFEMRAFMDALGPDGHGPGGQGG